MAGAWQLEMRADGAGILWADVPGEKVNLLSSAVMRELESHIALLVRDSRIKTLVFASRKEGCFFAGADIKEIREVKDPQAAFESVRAGQELFDRIAHLPFPTVAAVEGVCLGGGLELALACSHRVVSDHPKTSLGLPEIKVGIIPGFGGTQRLPRLIGLQESLKIILAGGSANAKKALRSGLADEMVPQGGAVEAAVSLGLRAAATHRPRSVFKAKGVVNRLLEGTELGRSIVFKKSNETVVAATRGHYPAPLAALEAVKEGFGKPMEEALSLEAKYEVPLLTSPVKDHLVRLYFWMEDAKKQKVGEGVKPLSVERVGVLGAGVMGGGIAQLASAKKLAVRMKDIEPGALGKGLAEAGRLFGKQEKRGRLKRQEVESAMARITPTLGYDGFSTLDVVMEAVVEKLEVKRAVLAQVEAATQKSAIFATNTSSLPIGQIAQGAKRPESVVGLHFFNPVEKMPLVEIIRGPQTGDVATATAIELTRKLGKIPVLCQDGPGFLVNRLLMPYLNESAYLLMEGAGISALDEALLDFGMPMGPARLMDEVGLDVALHVGAFLQACYPERMPGCPLLRMIGDAKLLGKKGGAGFYLYQNGRPGKENPAVKRLLPASPTPHDPEYLAERAVLPMINEASRILDEGIVKSAVEVDLGMILGTGFPPFRGGLLSFADTLGLPFVAERLQFYAATVGPRFAPAPRIVEMAKRNAKFHG